MISFFQVQAASVTESLASFLRLFKVDVADARLWLATTGLRLVLIWVMAWLTYRLLIVLGNRFVKAADDGDDSRLSYQEKRAQTIAQLLRSVGRVVVLLFALLLSLNLFINVGPLLAGAGILGLAVSFGAQSLVKDIIAGFFILLENQFAVGDVIEAAGKAGAVEQMSLRMVMLRDLEGIVHFIPNGQMATVSNKTRGWSRAVVDVGVAYESDVDSALDILREEAASLASDERWSNRFDGEPEVVGVQSLGDNAVTIRVMLRTQPGLQWEIAREFRRRVKVRLDKEGIDIPFPQRTVHIRHHGLGAGQTVDPSTIDAAAGGA